MSATRAVAPSWRDEVGVADMQRLPAPSEDERVTVGPATSLRTRDHAAIVYWTTDELVRNIVPYLVAGLRAGDKVLYVADDHPVDRIAAALVEAGVDVGAETSAGRLAIVSAADAFFPDGSFDVERALDGVRALARQAAGEGFSRVRLSVEMTYLLADVPGMEAGVEFEARANDEIFAEHPFVCICSFNGSRDESGDVLTSVLATHPVLIADGVPLVNPYYRPSRTADPMRPSRADGDHE